MKILLMLWVLIGAFSRILPHPANVTALTSLSLLAGTKFSKLFSIIIVLFSLLLSDLVLAYSIHYPIFGLWSLFNYSGFILIALLGTKLQQVNNFKLFGFVVLSTLGFWLWTNFGVWLTAGIYPTTLAGLSACYVAALPFLRNSLIGDLIWMAILLGIFKIVTVQRNPFSFASKRERLSKV